MDFAPLHRWIYSLWYPAILGTAGVALLLGVTPTDRPEVPPWEWVVALYLTLQHGEGVGREASYAALDAVADALEMLAMVLIFVALGYFTVPLLNDKALRDPQSVALLLAFLFLVPVAVRIVRGAGGRLVKGHRGFYLTLSALSISAAASVLWLPRGWNIAAVCVIILIYAAFFVVFNRLWCRGSFARPDEAAILPARGR